MNSFKTTIFFLALSACAEPSPLDLAQEEGVETARRLLGTHPVGPVRSTLTFQEPLSFERAASFASETHMDVKMIYVYARDEDGMLATLIIDGGSEMLDKRAEEILAHNGARLLGVGAFVGDLEPDVLAQTLDDERVWLSDVSADPRVSPAARSGSSAPSMAWELYEAAEY